MPTPSRTLPAAGVALAAVLALTILLSACAGAPTPAVRSPASLPKVAAVTPVPSPTVAAGTAPVTSSLDLVWWIADFMRPDAPGSGAALLQQNVRDFVASQDDRIGVTMQPKARYGRGGLLNMARSAQPVAPGVAPDLIVLDIAELPAAAASGLLQPLEDVVDPGVLSAMYPFARQAGEFDGHVLAIPFWADLEHLLYREGPGGPPPATWADVMTGDWGKYMFPLAGPRALVGAPQAGLQTATVSQYLSAGGTYSPASRQLVLEEVALLRVLGFYSEAAATGIIPERAGELTALDESLAAFRDGEADVAHVSARQYLANRAALQDAGYGALPGWDQTAAPVASGWAIGIVTSDPDRKRAAAALLSYLMASERLGPWSQAAGWLPALATAWESREPGPYADFLQAQLAVAVPAQVNLFDAQLTPQLQKAILSVLRDDVAPRDAVRSVATPVPAKGSP